MSQESKSESKTEGNGGPVDGVAFGSLGRAVALADKAKESDKSRVAAMGKRITKAREAKGWSIDRLSQESRVRYHSLYSYERGQKVPNVFNACRIAQSLGLTVETLCGFQKAPASRAPKKPKPSDA